MGAPASPPYTGAMVGLVLMALAFVFGFAAARRGTKSSVHRISKPGPYPPYDWFLKEQGPEEDSRPCGHCLRQ